MAPRAPPRKMPVMVISFWASFVTTLALAAGTVWTGARRRRRAHFVLAPATLLALAVTILLTERLVRALDFPAAEMRIHLLLAKSAVALVLPVVATGLLLVKRPRLRRVHRLTVAVFLLAVVVATATGIWVVSLSTPR